MPGIAPNVLPPSTPSHASDSSKTIHKASTSQKTESGQQDNRPATRSQTEQPQKEAPPSNDKAQANKTEATQASNKHNTENTGHTSEEGEFASLLNTTIITDQDALLSNVTETTNLDTIALIEESTLLSSEVALVTDQTLVDLQAAIDPANTNTPIIEQAALIDANDDESPLVSLLPNTQITQETHQANQTILAANNNINQATLAQSAQNQSNQFDDLAKQTGFVPTSNNDADTINSEGKTTDPFVNLIKSTGDKTTQQTGEAKTNLTLSTTPLNNVSASVEATTQTDKLSASNATNQVQLNTKETTSSSSVIDQVTIRIAQSAQTGQTKFNVQLHPAELGKVNVQLDIGQDGKTHITIISEKTDTHDLLKNDAKALERALLDTGLNTENGGLEFSFHEQTQEELVAEGSNPSLHSLEEEGDSNSNTQLSRLYEGNIIIETGVDISI